MYKIKFELNGFTVYTAKDGKSGIALIVEKRPDAVLLDIVMPEVDGFDVLKVVKKDARVSKIPVILLSNLDSAKDRRHACELGALYFLPKAEYLPKEVVKLVKELLLIEHEKIR